MLEPGFLRLLKSHPEALADRKQFAGLIKDLMPGKALKSNLILNLYDLGIHSAIEDAAKIDNAFTYRFTKLLCDEHGVSRRNADWAVGTWYTCYADLILNKKIDIASDYTAEQADCGEGHTAPLENTLDVTTDEYLYDWRNVYDYSIDNNCVIIDGYVDFDEQEVSVPDTIEDYPVTEIGEEAFQNCAAMKTIHLPSMLRIIRRKAFENCTFEHIELPESLMDIEYKSFGSCLLKSVRIPPRIKRVNRYVFSECSELCSVELPRELKAIEGYAFSHCSNLESIDVPEGTREIGELAFSNCEKLTKIRIPRSVVLLGRADSDSENVFGELTRQNVTIYCSPGSEALKYARKFNIKMSKSENFN